MLDKHPVRFLLGLKEWIPGDYLIEFAQYNYIPQTPTNDSRLVFLQQLDELTTDLFNFWLQNLPPEKELAIQSRVYNSSKQFVGHLGLIDFLTKDILPFQSCLHFFDRYDFSSLYLFHSGRSYHGYVDCLLKDDQWKDFFADLILTGSSFGDRNFVDNRWIGHALINGYSALRLSSNSNHHSKDPEIFRVWDFNS